VAAEHIREVERRDRAEIEQTLRRYDRLAPTLAWGGAGARRLGDLQVEARAMLGIFEDTPRAIEASRRQIDEITAAELRQRPRFEADQREWLRAQAANAEWLDSRAGWRVGRDEFVAAVECGAVKLAEPGARIPAVSRAAEPLRIHGMDEWDTLNAAVS